MNIQEYDWLLIEIWDFIEEIKLQEDLARHVINLMDEGKINPITKDQLIGRIHSSELMKKRVYLRGFKLFASKCKEHNLGLCKNCKHKNKNDCKIEELSIEYSIENKTKVICRCSSYSQTNIKKSNKKKNKKKREIEPFNLECYIRKSKDS